jgi:hypothetical protein
VTSEGLQKLISLLDCHNIPATFFTTALYAEKNKGLLKSLSENHEIASHSSNHSRFMESDLTDSKMRIESIIGKKIKGFRMPRFRNVDMGNVRDAGYIYDSSVNPTFIPGRYNNLLAKRKLHIDTGSGLIEIPVSVSPALRFPLFWLSFKNIPLPVYFYLCKRALMTDSYINLCFHVWEFDDLASFNIPWLIKNLSGKQYSERFEKLLFKLKGIADFSTISGFLDSSIFQ